MTWWKIRESFKWMLVARAILIRMFIIYPLITLLVLGIGYYLLSRWWLYDVDRTFNERGRAYRTALQIAFGEDEYYGDYQQFSYLLTNEARQSCLDSPMSQRFNASRGPASTPYCLLESPPHSSMYEQYCYSFWLQRCTPITLNQIVLEYPEIQEAVMQVIENPCQFYPSTGVLQKDMENFHSLPMRNEDGNFNSEYAKGTIIRDYYLNSKKELGCDLRGRKSRYKLILGFEGDAQGKHTIVKKIH